MKSIPTHPLHGGPAPKLADVIRVWRDNHCLREHTIYNYCTWARRFRRYCREHGLEEISQLTLTGVVKFARESAKLRGTNPQMILRCARPSLRAWVQAIEAQGYPVPQWEPAAKPPRLPSPLLAAFADYLQQHRGISPATINLNVQRIKAFLEFLRTRGCRLQRLQLSTVDAFIVECSKHFSCTTVARISGSVRAFLRFLRVTERISDDLALSVVAPVVHKDARPFHALAWNDVQRILRAINRSRCGGKRHYAMLLLMSTYGLGAAELYGLRLDDIDWQASTLRIVRPKTGVTFLLPLLPAVARTLVTYLRDARPAHAKTRHLFLSTRVPYAPLSSKSAIRSALVRYAREAGVITPYLSSHVLRRSHACRQVELGANPKVLGDILGHLAPESLSSYVRISTERLREIALRVP